MAKELLFLDLFAGGGGLSEGFIQSGYTPLAHVESDKSACLTLRTRAAYHWLKQHDFLQPYIDYLNNIIRRDEFYARIPNNITNTVLNYEINKDTLSRIFDNIDALLGKRQIDIIIGGPPCQAYSIVGRARAKDNMTGDKRNYLFTFYAEFLNKYKPQYFVFENVVGLLSARSSEGWYYFAEMRHLFAKYGYTTEYAILSAEEHGVLQQRKRVILIGRRGKKEGFFPEIKKWTPRTTVSEIFSDLPSLQAGSGRIHGCRTSTYMGEWQHAAGIRNDEIPVTWHQARPQTKQDLEIYYIATELWNKRRKRLDYNALPERLKTHKNRSAFLDRFKVVAEDLPFSHTIVAHIAKDGHYYIHPDIKQNRSITPREAARIQTFPDDYFFESCSKIGGRTPAFRQIGNAVPVLLARELAQTLKEVW